MLLSTTTYALQKKRYSYEDIVDICAGAGFDAIDFSFVVDGYYGEETETEAFTQGLLRLKGLAEDRGLVMNQAHSPYAVGAKYRENPERAFRNVVRSMKQAAMLGIPTIVAHQVSQRKYSDPGMPEKAFEVNMEYFRRLQPYCEEYGIRIALENSYQMASNKKILPGACSDSTEYCRYLDTLDRRWFVGCLDIGHAMLNSDPVRCIKTLGKDRLKVLHVHDVDGFEDSHTLPYLGIGNWDGITAALKEIGYDGDFTFEADIYQCNVPKEVDREANALLARIGRTLMAKIKTDVN